MRISEINIKLISGKHTVSRDDGKKVYEKIKRLWSVSERITINFANVLVASVSFMDEAFGHLALDYSQDELRRKLKFINMMEFDRALLNDIILSRVRQKKLSVIRKRVSRLKPAIRNRLRRRTSHK